MTSQSQVNGKVGQQLVSFSIWLSNKYHVNILLIYRPLCRNSFGLRFKNELLSPLYSIFSLKKSCLECCYQKHGDAYNPEISRCIVLQRERQTVISRLGLAWCC